MVKNLLSIIILLTVTFSSFSQGVFKYAYSNQVKVIENGTQLALPWAGGFNSPQFNHMDVNFDCYQDLIIYDRTSRMVRVFINDGISGDPSYHYAPEYAKFFPSDISDFMLLRDFNNDGKQDIFTYIPGGMKVYKNVSDSTLKFELEHARLPALLSNGNPTNVYAISIDYPNIDDIDGDGDLDILSINVWGNFVELYENISTDPDTMIFELNDGCWGGFFENVFDSIVLGANCKGNGSRPSGGVARHTGSTLTTLDLYANGAKDLLMGDVGHDNLLSLKNGGTATSATMVSVDYHFPGNTNVAVDIPNFPMSFYLDVNNNGRKDLIVSTNDRDYGTDTGNVWFYDNFGPNNLPNFQLDRKNLLVGEQVDVGTMAFPVLADISGDGLPDLMIGNQGYMKNHDPNTYVTEYVSQISYYKNIGSLGQPKFELVTTDLTGLSSLGLERIAPTFADMDGDGDNDLIFGESNGYLSYYKNIAPVGTMADFVLVSDSLMGKSFGVHPSPLLFDVDKDGKQDLLVGQKNGNTHLYLNIGTFTKPMYAKSVTDTLGGIYNYIPGQNNHAIPFIGKVKSSGENVFMVTDATGTLRFYSGLDLDYTGTFTQIDSLKVTQSVMSTTGADLMGNDSLELILGEITGGITYLNMDSMAFTYSPYPRDTCGQKDTVDAIIETKRLNDAFQIYPNPNDGRFTVKLSQVITGMGKLVVFDLTGKMVYQAILNPRILTQEVNLHHPLKPGIYIVQVENQGIWSRSKLVIK